MDNLLINPNIDTTLQQKVWTDFLENNATDPDYSKTIDELISDIPHIDHPKRNLSQSLYKQFIYRDCNKRFYEESINRSVKLEPSEAMKAGNRFEDLVFYGIEQPHTPPAFLTSRGHESALEKRIQTAAPIVRLKLKKRFDFRGSKQKRVQTKKFKGFFDLFTKNKQTGKKAIVDTKYSKAINSTFGKFGWYWNELDKDNYSHLSKNKNHLIQAKFYLMLAYILGYKIEDTEFWFAVADANTGKEGRLLLFKINLSEVHIREFAQALYTDITELNRLIKNGEIQKTTPNFKQCKNCPLADTCTDAIRAEPQSEFADIVIEIYPTL